MATDIAGLFGLTPQMYEQGIRQSAMNEGAAYARMAPEDRAIAGIYSAGASLGRAGGGLLGIEDPQMKLISARQSVIGQLDQTDPASLLKGAQILTQMGDQQGAFALADYARKAQESLAQTKQRQAAALASEAQAGRERQQATPNDIQISNRIASLRDGIAQLEEAEKTPENNRLKNLLTYQLTELERITSKEKPERDLRFGVDRESIAGEMYDNKSFAQLTPTEKAAVNKRVEEEQGRRAEKSAPKVYTPGSPVQPKDWMAFDQNVLSKDPTMQRTSTILSDAPSAIDIIRSSSTNDISAATLPGALARLTGEGKNMSNADVNRYARTGGLDDRLAQDAVKFFTGRTTDVKKDQAEKFAIALYRGALLERKKKLEDAAEQYGYSDSPNYKVALRQIDTQLGQFKLVKKGESAPTTAKTGDPLIDKYLFPQAESK
jgi:hypothetical protein